MDDEVFINKVKELKQDLDKYFNDTLLSTASAIKYLNYFNNRIVSLYRDTITYSGIDFITEINEMLEIINNPNTPKHYNKFADSLEIHLVKAWYNVLRYRQVNPFLTTEEDDDTLECFYFKYIKDRIPEELIDAIWKKACWFLLAKNPNNDEYNLRFKRCFRSLTDKQYERAYFYFSLLNTACKKYNSILPKIIIERLDKLLLQFIIHQRTIFDLDRVNESVNHCSIDNPLFATSISIPVPVITLTKIERKKKEDDRPVFLGDYVMKEEPVKKLTLPTRNMVVGKNNKLVKVIYRNRITNRGDMQNETK